MSYAWKQLRKAVDLLVIGTGSPRHRFSEALPHLLSLKKKDLPKEAHADFELISRRFSRLSDTQSILEGSKSFSDEEIVFTIARIVEMFDRVTRYQPMRQHSAHDQQGSVGEGRLLR